MHRVAVLKQKALIEHPIVIVAPYSPIGSCASPNLGGAGKIASMVRILARFKTPIVFVNSGHNQVAYSTPIIKKKKLGGVTVLSLTPFTLPHRKLGKALNLLVAPLIGRRLAKLKPSLLWLYNGYSFEAILAKSLMKHSTTPLAVQVEDLHLSRKRGLLNVKARMDSCLIKKVLPMASLVTCVNEDIQAEFRKRGLNTLLLPSILNYRLFGQRKNKRPFSDRPFALGYFGGLNEEKGADVLIQLAAKLPNFWRLYITGSGFLAKKFHVLAESYPGRVIFQHEASNVEMYELMMQCDAIVNPHKSIVEMGSGILPFKVFEALASERLLISTPLPDCGVELRDSVLFFDGTYLDLISKLEQGPGFYNKATKNISDIAAEIQSRYTEKAVFDHIAGSLELTKKVSQLRMRKG